MSTKVSALTQATNSELADASIAYVVTDPSGTPASKKSTLARLGALPASVIEDARGYYGTPASSLGNYTVGTAFKPRRDSIDCVGIRVYWDDATATNLKLSIYPGAGGAALGTVTIASSSAGYKTGTFATPVSLSRTTHYIAACWDGVRQTPASVANLDTLYPVQPGSIFRDYILQKWALYDSGDTAPLTLASAYIYLVEPVLLG